MPDGQALLGDPWRKHSWRKHSGLTARLTGVGALLLLLLILLPISNAAAQAPTITILGPPAAPPTKETQPPFSGTTTDSLDPISLEIFEGGVASGVPIQTATELLPLEGLWALAPLTGLADGEYTAQATQTDLVAEETGTSEAITFTVDATAPAVGLSSPADNALLGNANPVFSGPAGNAPGDNTDITLKVYPGTTPTGTPTEELTLVRNNNTWSTEAPGPHLDDGTYTAQAEQTDEAGNSGLSTPVTFTVDTTAPAVTLTQPPSLGNDRTPTLGGAAGAAEGDDPLVKITIYHGQSVLGSEAASTTAVPSNGSWSATSPSLVDGTYTAQAEQTDAAGNAGLSAPVTFTVDGTAPAAGITTPANGAQLNNPNPTLTGPAGDSPGDSTEVTLKIYPGTSPTGTPAQELTLIRTDDTWSTGAPGPHLDDGTYTARVEQTDAAGNVGHGTTHTFTIESHAPTVTLNALTTPTFNTTPSFSGSAGIRTGDLPTVTLKLYAGTQPTGASLQILTATVQNDGTWQSNPAAHLADGTYTARAEQSDAAGDTGVSAPSTFVVDTTPPALTLITPADGASTSTGSLTVSGAAGTATGDLPGITIELFSGASVGNQPPLESIQVAASAGQWSASVGGLGDGVYTLRAKQSDALGNLGISSARSFTVQTPVETTPPPPPPPAVHSAPAASFTVLPKNPKVGETVSLISTSTDSLSPIVTFAWDLSGTGIYQPAGTELTTSFATAGPHLVHLRVTAADGLSSVATTEVDVVASHPPLMQPFPIVRIAGSSNSKGARVTTLSVQAPGGSRIEVRCRGRGCPIKVLKRTAASSAAGPVAVTFRSFKRRLPPGVTLEIRVTRTGEIGKYTRFSVRRRKLPLRTDSCLDPAGVKPIACPAS